MPAAAVHHPVFARLYTLMSRREPAAITEHRRELLAGLGGRVLELGAGAGANFAHYPLLRTRALAIEQQRRMWLAPVPIATPVATHVLGRARRR